MVLPPVLEGAVKTTVNCLSAAVTDVIVGAPGAAALACPSFVRKKTLPLRNGTTSPEITKSPTIDRWRTVLRKLQNILFLWSILYFCKDSGSALLKQIDPTSVPDC